MINKDYVCKLGLEFIDEYSFDDTHHSFVFKHNNICVIVDDNICENNKEIVFDYSKYCEMQNKYMATFDKLYRFNFVDNSTYTKIAEWLNKHQMILKLKMLVVHLILFTLIIHHLKRLLKICLLNLMAIMQQSS